MALLSACLHEASTSCQFFALFWTCDLSINSVIVKSQKKKDVPVVLVVQAPVVQVRVVKKTVEDAQFQIVEKTAEAPQTQTIQVTQTSESLGIECDEGHELMLQGNDLVSVAKDVEDEANEVSEKSPYCMVRSSASGSTRQQHKQRATTQTAQEEERGSEGRGVREGKKKKGGQVEKEQGREEREKGRKDQRGRGQEGRKEEREAEEGCKGNVPCTSLRHTDMNNLNHIANNGTDTTKHTDVYNAQF